MSSDIGLFGLSPRANNLAVNLALKGVSVAVGNRSSDMIKECMKLCEKKGVEELVSGVKDASEFCSMLSSPRKVLLLGKRGSSIEKNISKVVPCLEEGDILVDGSGEGFETCIRRSKECEEKGIRYLTICVVGTDKEVLKGCGFLVSGDRSAYDELEVILKKASREVEYESCLCYVGSSVSASYVEMVLNGMITAEEESLSESYGMLLAAGFTNEEVSKSVSGWNKEELEGPLIENMVTVLRKKEDDEDGFVIDMVCDNERVLEEANPLFRESNDRRMNVSSISVGVSKAYVSECIETRQKLSEKVKEPSFSWQKLDHVQLVEDLRNAVTCSIMMSAIQAFTMIEAASKDYEWSINCSEVIRVIVASSIGRCSVLETVKNAIEKETMNALMDEEVCEILQKKQMSWRRVVGLSVISGVSMPVISSSLSSFDYSRREKLPQNLIMAQHDYYESSQFERIDMPRGMSYHCRWTKDHE